IKKRRKALAAKLEEMAEAEELAAALEALAEAERRAEAAAEAEAAALARAEEEAAAAAPAPAPTTTATSSGWTCPVAGAVSFTDTWGAARSSGRTHEGTDMMAASGTPTVAPVSGR